MSSNTLTRSARVLAWLASMPPSMKTSPATRIWRCLGASITYQVEWHDDGPTSSSHALTWLMPPGAPSDLLGRHAQAPRPGGKLDHLASGALPGRAEHRPRSTRSTRNLGRYPAPCCQPDQC